MNRSICWWPKKIRPFESYYSLLNKLWLWNQIGEREVRSLLGEKLFKSAHARRLPLWGEWISRSDMAALMPGVDAGSAFTQRYMGDAETNLTRSLLDNGLRFCPECLSVGYHSLLHNVRLISHCPIHGSLLRRRCPRCRKPLAMDLPKRSEAPPFSCKCGHHFKIGNFDHPPFNESEHARLEAVAQWIESIRIHGFRWLRRLADFRNEPPVLGRHVKTLASQMGASDPRMVAPAFLPIKETRSAKIVFQLSPSASGNEVCYADYDDRLIGVYKSIVRRLNRNLKLLRYQHGRKCPFRADRFEAFRANKRLIAMCAWRMYWEGIALDRPQIVFWGTSGHRNSWRLFALARLRSLCPEEKPRRRDTSSLWRDSHLLAAVCCGTLTEMVIRSVEVPSVMDAGRLATTVLRDYVPLSLSSTDDGTSAQIISWRPLEQNCIQPLIR